MLKLLKCSIILLIFFAYVETGYCQALNKTSYSATNTVKSTCPLSRVTPESKLASKLMFFMGNLIMLAICAGILIFAFSFLPKRVISCPVLKLAKAEKIIIMYGDKEIVIPGGSDELKVILANLMDERKEADIQIASMKMYIYVKSTRYATQVSMAGWNFINEEKNSRRLLNNMQVMKAIDSFIDKTAPAKV